MARPAASHQMESCHLQWWWLGQGWASKNPASHFLLRPIDESAQYCRWRHGDVPTLRFYGLQYSAVKMQSWITWLRFFPQVDQAATGFHLVQCRVYRRPFWPGWHQYWPAYCAPHARG